MSLQNGTFRLPIWNVNCSNSWCYDLSWPLLVRRSDLPKLAIFSSTVLVHACLCMYKVIIFYAFYPAYFLRKLEENIITSIMFLYCTLLLSRIIYYLNNTYYVILNNIEYNNIYLTYYLPFVSVVFTWKRHHRLTYHFILLILTSLDITKLYASRLLPLGCSYLLRCW